MLLVVNIAACAILIRAKFGALSRCDFAIGFEGVFLGFNRTLLSPKFSGLVACQLTAGNALIDAGILTLLALGPRVWRFAR